MTALPRSGSFAMVDPEHVAAVGPAAAILYARIFWRSQEGPWRASRAVMAQETGLSPEMIRTALRVLRDREWITGRRASAWDATVVWSPVSAGHTDSGDSLTSIVGNPALSTVVSPPTSIVRDLPTSPSVETPKTLPPTPQGESVLPGTGTAGPLAGFDDWYALFPRKVAKAAARKAWTQVTRSTRPDVIIAGLRRGLPELQAAHARGFCPHPASWLRAERWEDDTTVTPLRRDVPPVDYEAPYDAAYEATLPPPPRQDLYG